MKRHPVAQAGEIPPGGRKIVTVGRLEIGIFNVGGKMRAYRNACPHAGAPVCLGRISGTSLPSRVYEYEYGLQGRILRCPWHGWEFDVKTGQSFCDPSKISVRNYPMEVVAGQTVVQGPYVAETLPVTVEEQYVIVEMA
ncbi:MAG TPA: Rieske (2Fe-2S) protein [Opitutaceae bacterium]